MKPKLRWVHGLLLMSALATSFSGCGDDQPDTDVHSGGAGDKGAFHSGGGGAPSGGTLGNGGTAGSTPEGGDTSAGAPAGGSGDAGHGGVAGSGAETGSGGASGSAGSGGNEAGGDGGDGGASKGGTGGTSGTAGTAGSSGKAGGGGNGGVSGGGGTSGGGGAANKCGNGKVDELLEQCDSGSATGGTCSKSCTLTACDGCRGVQEGVTYLSCSTLTGADKTLCENLLRCVRRTRCAEQYTDDDGYLDLRACYCGDLSPFDDCFPLSAENSDNAHGRCVAEVTAAAKDVRPQRIRDLMLDVSVPVGKVFWTINNELTSCSTQCATCSSCRGLSCSPQSENRATRCRGANADKCDAYLLCLDQNHCAANPRACYCGNVDTTQCFGDAATPTTPTGACRDLANAVAGSTTPKEVGRQMDDNTTALGAIAELMTCSNSTCQTACGSGG